MSVFRKQYRALSDTERQHVESIKDAAQKLYGLLNFSYTVETTAPGMREFALARTKLEECVMWATKAIT